MIHWIRNTLRNRLRRTMWGRLLQQPAAGPEPTVLVVCATRHDERGFWQHSALGRSLALWRFLPDVAIQLSCSNAQSLAAVYNRPLRDPAQTADIMVFVHDDVWLADPAWLTKTRVALRRFDLVGVAGNTRRTRGQPAWLFRALTAEGFIWDHPHLSGQIQHGPGPAGQTTVFGPSPARCELLDGVFLAVDVRHARRSRLSFDERFRFHFYDMDFCRQARARGLSLGTWPIDLTHQSSGAFGSPEWQRMLEVYRRKWGR